MEKASTSVMNKWSTGFFVIACLGAILFAVIRVQSARDYEDALAHYRAESLTEAKESADRVSHAIADIYQGMRTISLLPSVRTINGRGTNLDANAHAAILDIYNNLVNNVAVSEIYIVPADIDPDATSAMPKVSREPILMFDSKVAAKETGGDPNLKEEEEHEYRLMREQMAYFKQHYPMADVHLFNMPFISGPEVITCDNSEYAITGKEKDRAGLVFSVPFYGSDGVLKGAVSAIIRSNALKKLIPATDYALINLNHHYVVLAKDGGQQLDSVAWVAQGKADPSLLFSTVVPIATADPQSSWSLWAGMADKKFLVSADAKAVRNFAWLSYGSVALLMLLSAVAWNWQRRIFNVIEQKVVDRTAERAQYQQRAELLETVVRSANDGVVITTANLDAPGPEIIYVNEAFTRISGYQPEEMIGKSPRILQNEFTKRETLDALKTALKNGQPFKDELLNVGKDGKQYWLDISIVPVKNADGVVTHFAAMERDITAKKQEELDQKNVWVQLNRANMKAEAATRELEESLKKSEAANKAKGDFLANMSHELRTPMNGVLGMAGLLADTNLDAEQKEFVSTINGSAENLLMLLNDILDFSKIEAGALELENIAFALPDALTKTTNLLRPQADKKALDLSVSVDADVPAFIWGDPGRIRQIITNLVGNAIKFTSHGHVRLKASVQEADAGTRLYVSVEDTGMGIPAEKLSVIFDKFTQADTTVTRKYGGTGLGLAISKQLVELMGGEVGVESALGKGSTFWFAIPYKVAEEKNVSVQSDDRPVRSQANDSRMPIGQARVLLVDDYPVNQVFAEKILRKFGFTQIDLAENGMVALDKFHTHGYDMIFMDCQMPELDGYITTEEVRIHEVSGTHHTPIIAMTANAMMGDREKCLNAGMDDYLSKPLRAEHLKRVLENWFILDPVKAVINAPKLVVEPAPKQTAEGTVEAEAPVVDLEQLRMFTDGDPEEEKALVALFLEQAQEMIAILEKSTGADVQDVWKSAAHRFKGSSGNFGATQLYALCKRAEMHFEDGEIEKQAMLAEIVANTKRVELFFNKD